MTNRKNKTPIKIRRTNSGAKNTHFDSFNDTESDTYGPWNISEMSKEIERLDDERVLKELFGVKVKIYDHSYRWSSDGPECDLCGFIHENTNYEKNVP